MLNEFDRHCTRILIDYFSEFAAELKGGISLPRTLYVVEDGVIDQRIFVPKKEEKAKDLSSFVSAMVDFSNSKYVNSTFMITCAEPDTFRVLKEAGAYKHHPFVMLQSCRLYTNSSSFTPLNLLFAINYSLELENVYETDGTLIEGKIKMSNPILIHSRFKPFRESDSTPTDFSTIVEEATKIINKKTG